MNSKVRAVLFDLDGTLLDTAPDLIAAANGLRALHGLAILPSSQFRASVSRGGRAILKAAFAHLDEDERESLVLPFLNVYRENIAVGTILFPGFEETLHSLEAAHFRLGIVTNKPAWLTEALISAMGLAGRFSSILCGDSLPEQKPHPAPVLEACRQLGVKPEQALMVGDNKRDIDSARGAGAYSLAAAFGYTEGEEAIEQWGADAVIYSPLEILSWLEHHERCVGS